MTQDTITKIESKLKDTSAIKPDQKEELLHLLGTLKTEINTLAKTDAEGSETVAGFTELSTHEATRSDKKPELLELSLEGLSTSVEEFEESHPNLVAVVNRISTTLA